MSIPADTRAHVRNYLQSTEFVQHSKLSTKHRQKYFANQVDVRKLIDAFNADVAHFRTNRMRVQMSSLVTLLALTAERVGAVVESSCYRGSNTAMAWKDVQVTVVPRQDTPHEPDVYVSVTFRLLKGGRKIDSYSKSISLFPLDDTDRAYCPVLFLLVLGLWDDVWEGIGRPEDILSPVAAPTAIHILRVKEIKRDLVVFRAEERIHGVGWDISTTEALSYDRVRQVLALFSREQGFRGRLNLMGVAVSLCNGHMHG